MNNVKVIAFDADDTLWVNEPYFRETEDKFYHLVADYIPQPEAEKLLFEVEIKNINLYGYGIKGFTLSLIETLGIITDGKAGFDLVNKTIGLGQSLLHKPVELLAGVKETLVAFNGSHRLVMASKGDLLDQERKLKRSGLEEHFHHIEIMSDKQVDDYQKLLKRLDCPPGNFMMVGNSLKSDVLPVLELGARAVHVPFHTTWIHEETDVKINNQNFYELENITMLLNLFR